MPTGDNHADDRSVLNVILDALANLPAEARSKIVRMVCTFYGIDMPDVSNLRREERAAAYEESGPGRGFSDRPNLSPKDFLLEKEPQTDVERVACLAYYLTHFRDTPHFKTLDISKLNTEAAQPKFANAAYSVDNASKMGYLAAAAKGQKQLSAIGERYVLALPHRDKAKEVLARHRQRRPGRRRSRAEEDSQAGSENQ
jgi:hypothetical protein